MWFHRNYGICLAVHVVLCSDFLAGGKSGHKTSLSKAVSPDKTICRVAQPRFYYTLTFRGSLSTDHELASQTHHHMPTFRLLGCSLLQSRHQCRYSQEKQRNKQSTASLLATHRHVDDDRTPGRPTWLVRAWVASYPGAVSSGECGAWRGLGTRLGPRRARLLIRVSFLPSPSQIFGWLAAFLWVSSIWFVYKDTHWHKDQSGPLASLYAKKKGAGA